ncbi:S8 family serine peptidase [Shewanella algae]|uniref:S8 family serine peptidase n=1 Tax=Shewanella algae TaxID=38313 RepID=UPI001AACEFEE|nr:S8 family serine peptidase [Shewanella algae]MBO2579417.1 S8 family serine peptidase [Shewanella algae]MBO2684870.1 S8 family serine peptidase [Shewanella algae]
MKSQVAIAVSAALLSMAFHSEAAPVSVSDPFISSDLLSASSGLKGQQQGVGQHKFVKEPGLAEGKYTYIVRLKDPSVANYAGGIAGLEATSPQRSQGLAPQKAPKLNTASVAVKSYVKYLNAKQQNFLMSAAAQGVQLQAKARYHYAFNGLAVTMDQQQAEALSKLPEVAFIERESLYSMDTDSSQSMIGSPKVWDGSATGTRAMGEGVIVGVIDSGINSDHPSFADIGGDGYDHTNPWGQGVYVGDCAAEFSDMCNDKLIGVRSYPEITDSYDDEEVFGPTPPPKNGEDYGGHGSHTASTAAGNILKNVPYVAGEVGEAQGDGIETGLKFTQISGVAPHANIVAYQICRPGNNGDRYSGCPTSAILKALDDAIADGVDVINYSISGGGFPWSSATEMSFLAARNAGIFSAVSAGNTSASVSQVPFSSPKNAPWYTSVAASTHNREVRSILEFNGDQLDYTQGTGPVMTTDISAPLVYAGDLAADNFEGCNAFAADAFKEQLALIKRGGCNFADKVNNAKDAGAVGVIVFNKDGEGNVRTKMSGLGNTSIPSVFIGNIDGLAVVDALAATPGLVAKINATPSAVERQADVLGDFSLLGPNRYFDVIAPSISAPGVDIYAAYADEQYGHEVTGTDPADYTLMSGTSMSSPHVAGAGALLKSAHPEWTPDNIRSALMLTATTASAMTKADGKTTADPFDVGAGRIRVDLAAKTGLIMDELADNYEFANPELGGDPRRLNLPSMSTSQCVNSCSWTRKVTATKDGVWSAAGVATTEGLKITVSPENFTLTKGQSQVVTVTADITGVSSSDWAFGNLLLTSSNHPDAAMPVAVKASRDNLPDSFTIRAGRDADELTFSQLKSLDMTGLDAEVSALALADSFEGVLKQDSDVGSFLDDITDGVAYVVYSVEDGAKLFNTAITATNSPDLDLYVAIDRDGDGALDALVGQSARAGSDESVSISNPEAGDYYIFVQNYEASAANAEDPFTLKTSVVEAGPAQDNFTLTKTGDNEDFSLKFAWKDNFAASDLGYAVVTLTSSDTSIAAKNLPVAFSRVVDDVQMPAASVLSGEMAPGQPVTMAVTIAANASPEAREYQIKAMVPEGHEVTAISDQGELAQGVLSWTHVMQTGDPAKTLSFKFIPRKQGQGNKLILSNTVVNDTAEVLTQEYLFDVKEGAPVIKVDAPDRVAERKSFVIDASASADPNGDAVSYQWTQIAGAPLKFDSSAAKLELTAPEVGGSGDLLTFNLKVSDSKGNSTTETVSIVVFDFERDSGGSLGWLSLLLLPLGWLRRKSS